VDKESFLKSNIEVDPEEVGIAFYRSPTYAEVVKKVRVEL
jgi:hypothetical protein